MKPRVRTHFKHTRISQRLGRTRSLRETMFRGRFPFTGMVVVDNKSYAVWLEEKPVAGATINVGFPARILETKDVAGGGVLIIAVRLS